MSIATDYHNISARDMVKYSRRFLLQEKQRLIQHITDLPEKRIIHGIEEDHIYIPSETGKIFGEDNHFIQCVMGPFGSGKTTMCLQKIITATCKMPYWHNGRRRARGIIVRNTSGELYSTTLQSWLSWFADLGAIKKRQKPLLTYEHEFNDGKGICELELIFIALDRPDDVRKIKSLEATFVYLNELSELPEIALSHFKGRVNGRYPSKEFCKEPYWTGIMCDTNPPSEDHWIKEAFESGNNPSYKIFKQPPGLLENSNGELARNADGTYVRNPNCDNAENLLPDYYTKLAEGQKQGYINVFCMGRYGLVETGKRVYPEYNDDIHSVDELHAIQGLPIHLGWDFGLTPSCVVFQITPRGVLHVLKEYCSENMGIRTFAKSIVLPSLLVDFPYNKVGESEGDPAGAAGDQIMEELSCIGELNSLGVKTNAATTNDPDVRIAAVRFYLNIMVDGKPGFVLARKTCGTIRKGFVSGYHYKRVNIANEERYQDKPNKNKYSQPHDALQYGALKFAGTSIAAQDKQPQPKIDMFNPVMSWGG